MKLKEVINDIKMKIRGEVPTNKLKKNGFRISKNFKWLPGVVIDPPHCWLITIGDNVTLAPRTRILAHDASTKIHLGYTKIGLVEIGNNVFIGAEPCILQNVKIGNGCIIGAGSIVTKSIPENWVVVGNSAKIISTTEEYIEKNKKYMKETEVLMKHGLYEKNK